MKVRGWFVKIMFGPVPGMLDGLRKKLVIGPGDIPFVPFCVFLHLLSEQTPNKKLYKRTAMLGSVVKHGRLSFYKRNSLKDLIHTIS